MNKTKMEKEELEKILIANKDKFVRLNFSYSTVKYSVFVHTSNISIETINYKYRDNDEIRVIANGQSFSIGYLKNIEIKE